MALEDSILKTVKKNLGLEEDYDVFDFDIITHINSVFDDLTQLGLGPADDFFIEDGTANWSELFAGSARLNSIKTYVYLRVRLLFDPPATSFHIEAINAQLEKLEWRLNVRREEDKWRSEHPEIDNPDVIVIP